MGETSPLAELDSSGARLDDLTDGLGSVRASTDGSATLEATADYDVFGGLRSSTGSPGAFRYTGEQWDPVGGFEFLRARYYDPSTGRFTSADTVQPNAEGTQGWNPYAYVANNPTTWVDPTGHYAAAAPRTPTAAGATSDSLAPYAVAAGVIADGALAGLGLKLAEGFLMLALVFAGAWVLVDIIERVTNDGDERETCYKQWDDDNKECRAWGTGKESWQLRCCESIASQNFRNCYSGNASRNPFPWDEPGVCVEKFYPEER